MLGALGDIQFYLISLFNSERNFCNSSAFSLATTLIASQAFGVNTIKLLVASLNPSL
jgi:hypothetical protein